MSDDNLYLIPTDPTWQAAPEAAERAAASLATFLPGAATVEVELYDEVTFVDQGGYFERVGCPQCQVELSMEWWTDRMDSAFEAGFADLTVTTPCCGSLTSLNDLTYDLPAGFARVALSVFNPSRGWLDDAELTQVAAALGHPLRQVVTRI